MSTTITEKKEFRKFAQDIRNNMDTTFFSNSVVEKIKNWNLYQKAKNIMIFYPIKSEISLLELLKDNKNFYFPIIKGDVMQAVLYNKAAGFSIGKYGINEPRGTALEDFSKLDMVFFPALAADNNGFRLGYGKGYYDRFSEHLNDNTIKVLPISSKLVFNKIPLEIHDKSADFIVTEKEIFSTPHLISNS